MNQTVYEHEIPKGSKLYFGASARLKRQIEQKAGELLENSGFSEIITPYFSYHQHASVAAEKLLRFSDADNHEIALRADSTVDVVRIATRRLKDGTKKWFYIQPVFNYPSDEIYQIGAEVLDSSNLNECLATPIAIFSHFGIEPHLQISNMEIPKIICQLLNLPISTFENGRLEVLLDLNLSWLNRLAVISSDADLDAAIAEVPAQLRQPLEAMRKLGGECAWAKKIYAPLYYSKMRYYDKLFFRFLCDNSILASGGSYEIEGRACVGFAVFTDALTQILTKKDNK